MTHRAMGEAETDVRAVIAGAAAGDERAWRDLLGLYARRVFALVRSRCRDDELAEEIAQSVFVTVAERFGAGRYDERGSFEPWLFRIAMNRLRDEMRRRARRAEPTDPSVLAESEAAGDPGPALAPGRAGEGPADLAPLRRAVARLGDADRETVELRHHAGLSFQQIADLLEEPLGTVLARHHRALKKLKAFMEEDAAERGTGPDR